MKKPAAILILLLGASIGLAQTITHDGNTLEFTSLERLAKLPPGIRKLTPKLAPQAPTGHMFVVVRFSLPFGQMGKSLQPKDARLGTVLGEAIKSHQALFAVVYQLQGDADTRAVFLFQVPNEETLQTFRLGKEATLDLSHMESAVIQ